MHLSRAEKKKLKKQQKLDAYRAELSEKTGILFSEKLTAEKQIFPFLKYILNAAALFGAVFGSLWCFTSAFRLDLSLKPMLFTCIIGSLILSFMYVNQKTKIATYLLIFIGIVTVGFRCFAVINTGLSAIRNNTLKYIDTMVDLPFLREFTLRTDDEFTAMSVTMCVFALAMMIILNIFISEKMSLFMLFVITCPVAAFGMYFDFRISALPMVFVVSSWVIVAAVKFTNAYNGLTEKLVSSSSVKKHRHSYGFVTDSNNVAAIAAVWLVFILCVSGIVFSAFDSSRFKVSLPTDSVRQSSQRIVKNFLSYGMSSVFATEKRSASPGQLSNVSNVVFDGRTDLKVSLVNYGADRIYLRDFTGYFYNTKLSKWQNPQTQGDYSDKFNFTSSMLKKDFESAQKVTQSKHKIGIQIVDPTLAGRHLIVPYYAVLDGDGYCFRNSGEADLEDNSQADKTRYYTFYTADTPGDYSGLSGYADGKLSAEMLEEEKKVSLEVPEENMEAIYKFCEEFGIYTQKDAVEKVTQAFETEFEYTLKPGKTPNGEDYINYFLNANRKGYCQHFATAAVLIFRYLGIPARYAEGYVINATDFFYNASTLEENAAQWIDSPYIHEDIVSQVNVADNMGHAWVEIYKKDYGWVPVEVTLAPADDSPEEQGLLSRLFGAGNAFSRITQNTVGAVSRTDFTGAKKSFSTVIKAVIAVAVGAYFARMVFIAVRRRLSFRTKNRKANIGARCDQLFEIIRFAFSEQTPVVSYTEMFAIFEQNGIYDDSSGFCEKLEKMLFSADEINDEDYFTAVKTLRTCRRRMLLKMPFACKLKYLFVKIMW